jgi:hypothetical protein
VPVEIVINESNGAVIVKEADIVADEKDEF